MATDLINKNCQNKLSPTQKYFGLLIKTPHSENKLVYTIGKSVCKM